MPFDALSNELISEICENLFWYPSEGLSNLSRCSQRLYSLVLPVLYSTIFQSERKAVPYFLRTIRVKPDLAKYVKHFLGYSLESFEDEDHSADLDLTFPGEEEATRQWIRSAIQEEMSGVSFSDNWCERIFLPNNWDAAVGFLLLLLPRLQSIEMVSYGREDRNPFIGRSLMDFRLGQLKSRPQDPSFGSLRTVNLIWCGTKGGLEVHEVLPYLNIPSVTEFRGRMIRLDGKRYRVGAQAFHTTTVQLVLSCFDARGMIAFLSCFHSLKRFDYEHAGYLLGGEIFSPPSVNEGLTNSAHCLEELVLYNGDQY
jgi:hypothetical protein